VDEVEVDTVHTESIDASLERACDVAGLVVVVAQFRREEDLFAWDAGCSDRCTYLRLVVVSGGCVDVPVSDLQRIFDHALRIVWVDTEHAEAELRNRRA
jgi:hypothetical protein